MTFEIFMTIQIAGMCFISYLMGYMIGANKGHAAASKTWKEAFENQFK
jgi:hypothetical protein